MERLQVGRILARELQRADPNAPAPPAYDRLLKRAMIRQRRRPHIYSAEEIERTGGIFRLAPAWVGRPGIIQPGRRIRLYDDYLRQDVAVNERWLASVTYADNGVYTVTLTV